MRLTLANRRLADTEARLKRIAQQITARRGTLLNYAAARLEALSPLAVLSRGYAIVYGPDGAILRSAGAVKTGLQIRARLADGSVRATVFGTTLDRNQEKTAS